MVTRMRQLGRGVSLNIAIAYMTNTYVLVESVKNLLYVLRTFYTFPDQFQTSEEKEHITHIDWIEVKCACGCLELIVEWE